MPADPTRSADPLADRRAAHAERLLAEGDAKAAADLMRQALALDPDWTLGRVRLAAMLEAAGDPQAAIAELRRAATADDGRFGTVLSLARLGAAEMPAVAPSPYVAALFDDYAPRFERSLVEKLGYRAPDILMEELAAVRDPLRFEAALDLGCGTGLMGERLRPVVERLDGIDLSAKMLRIAAAKRFYDGLAEGDLLADDPTRHGAFDLVTAADVLIYVGDLAPVFANVRRMLRADGLFAFTLETHGGQAPFVVQPSSRFAHARMPLREALEAAGLDVLGERAIVARLDRGEPVEGLAVVAAFGGPASSKTP